MSQASDFDELVERSRMIANKLGEQALWKAAVSLESWYFLGAGPEGDEAPAIGSLEGKPFVLVFTDQDRASDFGRRQNMRRSDARGASRSAEEMDPLVMNMDLPDAIDYMRQLKDAGVEGALFNSGAYAFQSSLIELIDRYERASRG
ncbi:MAG: hypothetical protein GC200_07050 [Tepidisphaera sp.]|nr:hypothetical protein [Tepidisphaera sp.]